MAEHDSLRGYVTSKVKTDELTYIMAPIIAAKNGVIAIDGRCCAGKSTLATLIAEQFSADIIHMDDFFLQPHQRTPERLSQVGGNIDYERFEKEVISAMEGRTLIRYRPFSCKTFTFGEEIAVTSPIVIVEGAYSHHPLFGRYMSSRVFLTVDNDEQLRRVETRNGSEAVELFKSKWIPMEERYFAANLVAERANIVINTTNTK